jgi:hypothetical protein
MSEPALDDFSSANHAFPLHNLQLFLHLQIFESPHLSDEKGLLLAHYFLWQFALLLF